MYVYTYTYMYIYIYTYMYIYIYVCVCVCVIGAFADLTKKQWCFPLCQAHAWKQWSRAFHYVKRMLGSSGHVLSIMSSACLDSIMCIGHVLGFHHVYRSRAWIPL